MQFKRRNFLAILLRVGKPWRCSCYSKTVRKKGPNGGLKAISTSTPVSPSVCMRQRAGGREGKCRGVGIRYVRIRECWTNGPQWYMRDAKRNTYSSAPSPHLLPEAIPHIPGGPGRHAQPLAPDHLLLSPSTTSNLCPPSIVLGSLDLLANSGLALSATVMVRDSRSYYATNIHILITPITPTN